MKDAIEFISSLELAVKNKDKKDIKRIYDLNYVNWENAPDHIFEKYDNLVDLANDILLD